mgnify:FL=1|jgi:LysR family transcriptional regulator, glycine cleavage system transcriptional activator
MARRHYNLPPLTTLAAFEAAARHLSFKDAAQELSVTPGAVSHQIKALEGELSATLFWRKHRGVELTEDGSALFDTLSASFSHISNSLQSIRGRKSRDMASIGSTSAVSTLYLARATIRFWRQNPEILISQVVQDIPFRNVPEVDLYLRYGQAEDTLFEQTELFRDILVPVGNAETASNLAEISLEDLAKQRLIYLESTDKSWTTWAEWFRGLGYKGPIAPGLRVNNYAVALEAASEGAGLALGWQRLVLPLLHAKKLIPVGSHSLDAPHSFFLVSRPEEKLSHAANLLKQWILDETTGFSHELKSLEH